MSFTISNNALISLQYGLNKSNFNIQQSILRLSTGFRINSAKDDAANLSLAAKLKSQMAGNLVAKQNTQKAQDYISMADGALSKMEESAQEIRKYLLQAANDTYSDEERTRMQEQINEFAKNIRNIRNNTTYNDIKIFGEEGTTNIYNVEKLTAEQAIEQGYTIISTAEDLKNISGTGKYILMADIDLAGSNLGTKVLSGTFDGNGYTIRNLGITKEDGNVRGLFTKSTGTIRNVTLLDINIDTEQEYVGGLVGSKEDGTITNCVVTGTITSSAKGAGGMIGYLYGTLENVMADVNVKAKDNTGGLVGGMYYGASITNGAAKGNVDGANAVGGLVGQMQHGRITDCYATGNVISRWHAGAGLIGWINAYDGSTYITNCYSTGDVTGTRSAGSYFGFVGVINNSSTTKITNCYSTGNVTSNGGAYGFSGSNSNTSFKNCFSTGTVSGNPSYTYAFGPTDPNKVSNCYVSESTGGKYNNEALNIRSAEWFQTGSNLTFLGENFDYNTEHPQILTNKETVPKPSEVAIQIGANDGRDNRMSLDLSFSLPSTVFNISTNERIDESIQNVDKLLDEISLQRAKAGYKSAMLDDIMTSQTVRAHNYESSISTIMDTDYAKETANLVKNQILQEVTSSLISQANISQSLALDLLNNNFIGTPQYKNNIYWGIMKRNK